MSLGEIISGEGLRDLKLGEDRESVRQQFGGFRTFRRAQGAVETDQFVASGILVTYGSDEKVEFIELAPPASPTIQGVELLGRELSAVLEELRAAGLVVITDQDGAAIEGWRVGLYAPSGVVEGVSIGE